MISAFFYMQLQAAQLQTQVGSDFASGLIKKKYQIQGDMRNAFFRTLEGNTEREKPVPGELAELLGVSRQAVSKWELGERYPEVEKLLKYEHSIAPGRKNARQSMEKAH